jgi:hypothetical protein
MPLGYITIALAFMIFALEGVWQSNFIIADESAMHTSQLDSLANQMAAYKGYASIYLRLNPTKTGTVSDTDMGVPTWFNHRDLRIKNYFSGGVGYIYCTNSCPIGLESKLSDISNNSLNVGLKTGNYLSVKGVVNSSIPVPAPINPGDIVYIFR